ncbi:MAG: hypothetical protein ACLSFT_08735 [Ruminococcus callidus]
MKLPRWRTYAWQNAGQRLYHSDEAQNTTGEQMKMFSPTKTAAAW